MSRTIRARFDIVVVFPGSDGGAYLRMTSDKRRSLPAAEIMKCLREYADMIEKGLQAEQLAGQADV